eukprot:jgi/Picre1/29812/NNA_005194.t1
MDEKKNSVPGGIMGGTSDLSLFQSPFDSVAAEGKDISDRSQVKRSEGASPTWEPQRTGSGHKHPNVFVRGVPLAWSEEEMITLFETCGTLTSLRLVRHNVTKVSLGYGFVRYGCLEDAQRAVDLLNGHVIAGQTLCVKFADADAGPPLTQSSSGLTPCDSCYVKHVPASFGAEQVRSLFSMCGKVIDVKMFDCLDKFRGSSALVKMDSIQSASSAIQTLNGMKPGNSLHGLVVRFAESAKEKNERLARKQEAGGSTLVSPQGSASLDAAAVQQALSVLYQVSVPSSHGGHLPERSLSGNMSIPQALPVSEGPTSIQIQQLPLNADRLWVYENFSSFGGIASVVYNAQENIALVRYTSRLAACEAVQKMNNFIAVDTQAMAHRKLVVFLME